MTLRRSFSLFPKSNSAIFTDKEEEKDTITKLLNESLIQCILYSLRIGDLVRLSQTSKKFHELVQGHLQSKYRFLQSIMINLSS